MVNISIKIDYYLAYIESENMIYNILLKQSTCMLSNKDTWGRIAAP